MAVHHALFVVLCDAVGGAERHADCVVCSGEVDVGDTRACVSGVDDRLAVGAVVNLDAGFDCLLVGGIERQRHVVEVLLQQLDCPGHQLRTVGLGRTDVDIQIRCASLDLLCGTLEDGIGVERCHSLADHRGDAVDTLADGDELRGFGISLLVVCVEIVADLDGGDGGSDLLEVQRSIGVDNLLRLCRLLGSGSSLCGSLVLAVFEVLDQLNSLAGTDDNVPIRQLVLNFALHDGNLARDDEGTVVDLVCQIELVEELLDGGRGELAGCPCRQDGHAGSVGDQQVDGHLGALEFAGDQEVGQREVDRQGAGVVGRCAVDRIDAGRDLHRLLRVGEDILTQTVQRQSLCVADLVHDDDRAVFQNEDGSKCGFQMLVVVAQNAEIDQRRITEGTVAVLDGGAADENCVCEGFLDGLGGNVENQVLVASLLQSGDGVVQLGQVCAMDAQNDTGSGCDGVHCLEVILVGAVEDGLVVLDCLDSCLCGVDVLGVDDDGTAFDGGCLLAQLDKLCAVACVVNEDALHHLALADALIVNLLDAFDARFDLRVVHAGAQRCCEQVAVDEGLLVTHHDGLAAELMFADRDGLHGRRGSFRQKSDRFFGHVGALCDFNGALGNLHAESHTCGAAALFTVLFR